MRCRIAQGTQRVHRTERFLAATFQTPIHALGLIHYENRARGLDKVYGFLAAGFLRVLIEVVDVFLVDRSHSHHHDLNVGAGSEVAHLAEFARVVEKVLKRDVGIECAEMVLHDLE